MCGLLGLFSSRKLKTEHLGRFKRSLSLTSHRGPDETVEYYEDNFCLGFNRLSIVGNSNGTQPLHNESNDIYLLCNGEIFNYRELRHTLESTHTFSSNSDCEVILHLYEENPDTFVNKLRGQFAFVLFDKKKQKIIMARDRFGIIPLFYSQNSQGELIVSSEIKSILSLDNSISQKLDTLALKQTLFLYGPTPPRTCFEKIYQVIPGHVCTYDLVSSKFQETRRYWQLPNQIKSEELNFEDISKEFLRLFKISIERRLQGDELNPGIYLSGGIDSSSVGAILSGLVKKGINAYSIQFEDTKYDETKSQKKVAKSIRAQLHAIKGDESIDPFIFQTIWHTEHPLIRTAPIAMFALSAAVRKNHVKYVLCGEGADEHLLGYPVFTHHSSSVEDKVTDYSELDDLFLYSEVSGKEMVSEATTQVEREFNLSKDSVRSKQLIEIDTKLSRFLLVSQGDRQSMSHCVEQRFPFLDEDLTDFLFTLPDGWFKNYCMGKSLLKRAMSDYLPSEIINRKKQGYQAPMAVSMYRSTYCMQIVKDYREKKSVYHFDRYFRQNKVDDLFDKYSKEILNETEAVGLLFVISAVILDNQFFS